MPARGLHHSNHHPKERGSGRGHYYGQVAMTPLSPPPDQPNPPSPDPPPPSPPPTELGITDGGQQLADMPGF